MRYHPNGLKSFFLIKRIRNWMARTETINATAIPVSKMPISPPVMPKPVSIKNFTTFKRLAPSMAGIARKKVNSAATAREAAKQHSADNSSAGARGARYQSEHLKHADPKHRFIRKRVKRADGGSAAAVQMLHHNKQDAVKNQGDGNGLIIIKKGIQRIVKQKSDDACPECLRPKPWPRATRSSFSVRGFF